jgi:hypothetical protein
MAMDGLIPRSRPFEAAVVLGTDDVASAVAYRLHGMGLPVLAVRDPTTPVLRRDMAFDDAVEAGAAILGGVRGRAADSLIDILDMWRDADPAIPVTALPPDEVLCLRGIGAIVDARMRRRAAKVDLRPFAPLTIGLGPGFEVGGNVDVAVETAPEATGRILRQGETIPAHGRSAMLGGSGRERFGRAPCAGSWHSPRAIGDEVREGELIGLCGGAPMVSPLRGRLRGLVRDSAWVPEGARLLEVDPRPGARCHGIPPRAAAIAEAVASVFDARLSGEPWLALAEARAWPR